MPKVKPGESQKDFVARCIPIVLNENSKLTQKQAAGKCFGIYRSNTKKKSVDNIIISDNQTAKDKKISIIDNVIKTLEEFINKQLTTAEFPATQGNIKQNRLERLKKLNEQLTEILGRKINE